MFVQRDGAKLRFFAKRQPGIAEELATPAEQAAHKVAILFEGLRARRNALLSASDWTQLADFPGANQAAWATYRQALRDLPANTVDPKVVTWPEPPK